MDNDNEWTVVTYKKNKIFKPKPIPSYKYQQLYNSSNIPRWKLLPKWKYTGPCRKLTSEDTTLTHQDIKRIISSQFNLVCECCDSFYISQILRRLYVCKGCYCCQGDDVSYDMYESKQYVHTGGIIETRFGRRII